MLRWLLGLLTVLALPLIATAEGGKDQEPATVRKTQDQLHFQLPPDWPIERRGGIVGPIPVEEYLAQKFNALDARLQMIEREINGFDLRLRVLEEAGKKSASGLKSTERSTSP